MKMTTEEAFVKVLQVHGIGGVTGHRRHDGAHRDGQHRHCHQYLDQGEARLPWICPG